MESLNEEEEIIESYCAGICIRNYKLNYIQISQQLN